MIVIMNQARALVDEIRLLLHRLVRLTDDLHADLDASTSERAVLEFLEAGGGSAVPDIARARGVSRQHIQTIVNGLLDRGLVGTTENPAHRRSPIVELTPAGRTLIEEMLRREQRYLADRLEPIGESALAEAAEVIREFRLRI